MRLRVLRMGMGWGGRVRFCGLGVCESSFSVPPPASTIPINYRPFSADGEEPTIYATLLGRCRNVTAVQA